MDYTYSPVCLHDHCCDENLGEPINFIAEEVPPPISQSTSSRPPCNIERYIVISCFAVSMVVVWCVYLFWRVDVTQSPSLHLIDTFTALDPLQAAMSSSSSRMVLPQGAIRHFVVDGCRQSPNQIGLKTVAVSSDAEAAVQCCDLEGNSCKRSRVGCSDAMLRNFSTAQTECASQGLQLCSLRQLESGLCCGLGCLSGIPVWSSTESKLRPYKFVFQNRVCDRSHLVAASKQRDLNACKATCDSTPACTFVSFCAPNTSSCQRRDSGRCELYIACRLTRVKHGSVIHKTLSPESNDYDYYDARVDCLASPWTPWSECSKHSALPPLRCLTEMNVVLIVDGALMSRKVTWQSVKYASSFILDKLEQGATRAQVGVMMLTAKRAEWIVSLSQLRIASKLIIEQHQRIGDFQVEFNVALADALVKVSDIASTVIVFSDDRINNKRMLYEVSFFLGSHAHFVWVPISSGVSMVSTSEWDWTTMRAQVVPSATYVQDYINFTVLGGARHPTSNHTVIDLMSGICPSALSCDSELDVVLILDGSTFLGEEGWATLRRAAMMLVYTLRQVTVNSRVGLILLAEAATWIIRFSWDLRYASHVLESIPWPNTKDVNIHVGLSMAYVKMLKSKRRSIAPIVIALLGGRPSNMNKTAAVAARLRGVARLVWVPMTPVAPPDALRQWASLPSDANVLKLQIPNVWASSQKASKLFIESCVDLCVQLRSRVICPDRIQKNICNCPSTNEISSWVDNQVDDAAGKQQQVVQENAHDEEEAFNEERDPGENNTKTKEDGDTEDESMKKDVGYGENAADAKEHVANGSETPDWHFVYQRPAAFVKETGTSAQPDSKKYNETRTEGTDTTG